MEVKRGILKGVNLGKQWTFFMALFFTVASVVAKENDSIASAGMYDLIRHMYYENYIISYDLRDGLASYAKRYKNSIQYNDSLSEKKRYEYFETLLIDLELQQGAKDSIYLLRRRIEREELIPKYKVRLFRAVGVAYDHLGDSAKALELFFDALDASIAAKDSSLVAFSAHHVSYIINYRFPNTLQWNARKDEMISLLNGLYGEKDLFAKFNDPNTDLPKQLLMNDLPETSIFFEGYDEDMRFVREELVAMKAKELKFGVLEGRYYKQKGYERLLSYFENRHKRNNLYYNVVHSYILFLVSIEDYESAAFHADELNAILPENIGYDYFDYGSFYEAGAQAYKAMGAFEKGLLYTELKNQYGFSLDYNIERTYDYLFSKINGASQAKIELAWVNDKKRSTIVIVSIIIVTGLVLVILYISLVNGKRIRLTRNKALRIIREKERLEGKIEMLESVISKDLHDNFGNRITGILHSYEIMREINETERLNSKLFSRFNIDFEKGLTELLTDIKDLVWVNEPQNNSLDRLLFRLQNHFVHSDCAVQVISTFEKDIVLPKFWNRQLFLIFKEALENACQHSGAERIELRVYALNELQLILEARDNGMGFQSTGEPMTSGLYKMKRRAESIAGDLRIRSSIKKGTTITFTSPEFDMHNADQETKTAKAS